MKFIVVLFHFLPVLCQAQFEGRFSQGHDYIEFRNGNAQFEVADGGGVTIQIRGFGNYEILENYLLIHTITNKSLRHSSYDSTKSKGKTTLTIVDEQGNPMPGVNVAWLGGSGKILGGGNTGSNGILTLEPNKAETIEITFIGYDDLTVNPISGFDYKITMVEDLTLENKTVVFKMINSTNDALELKLLTNDFRVRHPTRRDLARLSRRVKIDEIRLRRLTK